MIWRAFIIEVNACCSARRFYSPLFLQWLCTRLKIIARRHLNWYPFWLRAKIEPYIFAFAVGKLLPGCWVVVEQTQQERGGYPCEGHRGLLSSYFSWYLVISPRWQGRTATMTAAYLIRAHKDCSTELALEVYGRERQGKVGSFKKSYISNS